MQPGSPEFQEAFDRITALKNNEGEGGTRFYDRSSLIHMHGERTFKPTGFEEDQGGRQFPPVYTQQ